MAQFTPNNGGAGSPVSAALLNGLVQAQGYVQSGGAPPTSASLVVTMPATAAVVPIAGGLSVWVSMASGALPALTASNDSYIDLQSTTSYPYTGTYVVASVANGAAAPAVAANGLRLCKVVTNGTAATTVTALASIAPLPTGAVRQIVEGVQGSAGSFTSASLADWPGTPTVSITPATGGRLRVTFMNQLIVSGTPGAAPLLSFYGTVDGTPTRLWNGNVTILGTSATYLTVYGEVPVAATAGVAHSVKVQATIGSQSAQSFGTVGTVVLIVEEIA